MWLQLFNRRGALTQGIEEKCGESGIILITQSHVKDAHPIKTHASVFHLSALLVKRVLLVMQYTGNAFPTNQTVAMATSLPRAHHQKDSTKPYTLETVREHSANLPQTHTQPKVRSMLWCTVMLGFSVWPSSWTMTWLGATTVRFRMNLEKGLFKVSLMTWMLTCMRFTMQRVYGFIQYVFSFSTFYCTGFITNVVIILNFIFSKKFIFTFSKKRIDSIF